MAWGHHKTHIAGVQFTLQTISSNNKPQLVYQRRPMFVLPPPETQTMEGVSIRCEISRMSACKATCTEHLIKFSLIYKLLQVIFLQFLTVLAAQQLEYVQQ